MGSDDEDNENMNEDESSDVELTGVEMEGDDEDVEEAEIDDDEAAEPTAGAAAAAAAAASGGGSDDAERMTALLSAEAQEMEEAKKERAELMSAELEAAAAAAAAAGASTAVDAGEHANQAAATPQQRLEYLIAQSEVFAHFLAGAFQQAECFFLATFEREEAVPISHAIVALHHLRRIRGRRRHLQEGQERQGCCLRPGRRPREQGPSHRGRGGRAVAQVGPVQEAGDPARQAAGMLGPHLQDAPVPARGPQLAHQATRQRNQRSAGRRNVRAAPLQNSCLFCLGPSR